MKYFIEGTQIAMADGSLKSIETIKFGDSVITYNVSVNTLESKPVLIIITVQATMVITTYTGALFNKNTFDHS